MNLSTSLLLTQVCTALKELLDVGSGLHSIDQLYQPRVLLELLSPILNEVLILQQLEENQVCVSNLITDDVRPAARKI